MSKEAECTISVGGTVISEKRTPATAPLSLARVNMSLVWEASVELASHETRAIQGVTAEDRRNKALVRAQQKSSPHTGVTREVLFTEVHECTLNDR